MALSETGYIVFYVMLFGVGSLVSIGIPIGIMIFNAIKDRNRTTKAVPIVLRMFNEDGKYEELIGIPHDMVVQFLEATYNVKIVTNQPKPRPPDNELLKWLRHSMSRGPIADIGTNELNSQMKEYMPYDIHKSRLNMSKLLAKLEDYRR